jgi:hypothetical protein
MERGILVEADDGKAQGKGEKMRSRNTINRIYSILKYKEYKTRWKRSMAIKPHVLLFCIIECVGSA